MAERRRLFAFDTSLMILFAGGSGGGGDRERLEQFIEDQREQRLAIPAAALAECTGLVLPDGWEVLDLTMEAAILAQKCNVALQGRPQKERRRIKIDALIVATAAAHGATKLLSLDKDMVKLARLLDRKLVVEGLPDLRAWHPELKLADEH